MAEFSTTKGLTALIGLGLVGLLLKGGCTAAEVDRLVDIQRERRDQARRELDALERPQTNAPYSNSTQQNYHGVAKPPYKGN